MTHPGTKNKMENHLLGTILTEGSLLFSSFLFLYLPIEGIEDFFNQRMDIGRSISAPPTELNNAVTLILC